MYTTHINTVQQIIVLIMSLATYVHTKAIHISFTSFYNLHANPQNFNPLVHSSSLQQTTHVATAISSHHISDVQSTY